MKNIIRIVVSAFAFISAAACYNNEIENPDNPQNPEQPGLRITATMTKTRVNYGNETDAQLLPVWEEGDILFGFYVDGSKVIQNFILKVVDTSNSTATLDFVKGNENGLADQPRETKVYLIYTGKNGDSSIADTDIFSSTGEFSVDLTSQNLDRIPVCMSASAEIEDGSDGEKTLSFNFAYDCAVLEIQSLRGFKEDKSATSISKIEVTDLVLGGTYKYDRLDGFRFEPNTSTATYSVPVDPDKWDVNADGKLVYDGNPKGFLIAAAPNSTSKEIKVKVYNSASSETPYFVHPCNSTTISAGRCYVVRSEEVVAKTIDDLYFTTVKAAFDHARELSKLDDYDEEDENVVTLLASKINGLGENSDSNGDKIYEDLIINIDYPVTLDLNNCEIWLNCDSSRKPYFNNRESGGFQVAEGVNFTVTDNSEDEEGLIRSNSGVPLIDNEGSVSVECGYLYNYLNNVVENKATGTLTVNGGEIYSQTKTAINNTNGKVYIYDGEIDNNGGYLIPVINSSGGTVEISGGYIYNTFNISGGQVITIIDGASCTISGGLICGYGYGDPTIGCFSEDEPASSLTIQWPGGTEPTNRPCEEETLEPFIYADSSSDTSYPVSTYIGQTVNTAQITIMGGYLITSNGRFYCDFNGYSDNSGDNKDPNLKLEDEQGKPCFGGFYSNASQIKFGSYIRDFTDEESRIRMLGEHDFIAIEDESDKPFGPITNPETEDEIATLYKIIPNVSSSD